jgi:hypothetical protein
LPPARPLFWIPPSVQIEPLAKLGTAERKAKLVIKLMETFPAEAGFLLQLAGSPKGKKNPSRPQDDIHVFIDSSNVDIPHYSV